MSSFRWSLISIVFTFGLVSYVVWYTTNDIGFFAIFIFLMTFSLADIALEYLIKKLRKGDPDGNLHQRE